MSRLQRNCYLAILFCFLGSLPASPAEIPGFDIQFPYAGESYSITAADGTFDAYPQLSEGSKNAVEVDFYAQPFATVYFSSFTFDAPCRCTAYSRPVLRRGEAVHAFVEQVLSAFPDLWVRQLSLHHADEAVIVEAKFGGTQRGIWAGLTPTEKKAEVDCVLLFIFEGSDLVCEKVYFDNPTILHQLGALA